MGGVHLDAQKDVEKKSLGKKESGLYATIETSMGKIVCRLYEKATPLTVENFVDLAEGKKEWADPKTGAKMKKRFYDGLTFHRVMPNFMIQGGCPLGNGTGSPGYQFQDEIVSTLRFDRPGLLAMANSGPDTNGSQFFITHIPTPWLDGRHTIFGEVLDGQNVVVAIGNVACGMNNRPLKPVLIKKVTIERVK
ncbi:MAG: peptidylprolyl isomerase [Elusimicrobia bacterium]|nr:peptidylprolyl isomerase [Elusimicrobiota bacterium]